MLSDLLVYSKKYVIENKKNIRYHFRTDKYRYCRLSPVIEIIFFFFCNNILYVPKYDLICKIFFYPSIL